MRLCNQPIGPIRVFPRRALSIYVDFTESYSLHIKNNVTHVTHLQSQIVQFHKSDSKLTCMAHHIRSIVIAKIN